jgi:hypothetical protein
MKKLKKVIWTLDGRKKVYLVDESNHALQELEDLGPLNDTEMLWVRLRPGKPYEEWLIEYKKEQELENKNNNNK